MRCRKLKESYYNALKAVDSEVLDNDNGKRPYVVLLELRYKGKKQSFAIPFRSNIAGNLPKHTYFTLPRRHTTRECNKHGLHYIKLVPANNKLLENVQLYDNSKLYLEIIEKNIDKIKSSVQEIIDNYENGQIELFSTNINLLLDVYEQELKKAKSYDRLKISVKKNILIDNKLFVNSLEDIEPQNLIEVKGGTFHSYSIAEEPSGKMLSIFVNDEYKQIKSIAIKIILGTK